MKTSKAWKADMERQRVLEDLDPPGELDPAATGLDLVERTAELIRATEEHAAEMVARAEAAAAPRIAPNGSPRSTSRSKSTTSSATSSAPERQ